MQRIQKDDPYRRWNQLPKSLENEILQYFLPFLCRLLCCRCQTNDDSCRNNSKVNCKDDVYQKSHDSVQDNKASHHYCKSEIISKTNTDDTTLEINLQINVAHPFDINNQQEDDILEQDINDPNIHYFYSSRNVHFIATTQRPK